MATVTYKIKPRVKLYFFGIFSRVLYDLVKETDTGDSPPICGGTWGHGSIQTKKVLATYGHLNSAEKELKYRENGTIES